MTDKEKEKIQFTTEQLLSVVRENCNEEPSSEAVAITVFAATVYESLQHI